MDKKTQKCATVSLYIMYNLMLYFGGGLSPPPPLIDNTTTLLPSGVQVILQPETTSIRIQRFQQRFFVPREVGSICEFCFCRFS